MIKFTKHREMEFRGVLIEFVQLFQPEVYCEIGVKKGYTFNEIAQMVDLAIGIDPAGFSHSTRALQKALPGKIELYKMTSDEFSESVSAKIDFLFIDGDHSAEQLERDLLNFLPMVQEDTGLIFLHDTYPTNPELAVKGFCDDAWKVAEEIWEDPPWKSGITSRFSLEIVTIPGPWAGLSILRKRGKYHLHWQGETNEI